MTHRRTMMILVFVPISLWALGCTAPAKPTSSTVGRVMIETADDYDFLWDAVGSALRQHNFRLDRQDRLAGVITTYPETSASGFELWRHQPQPAYYWLESNLQTIQRSVTVHIKPEANNMAHDVDVQVARYRYNLEERQVDNPALAMRTFSNAAPTTSGKLVKPSESGEWIPLGRDAQMEESVLSSILARYGQVLYSDVSAEASAEATDPNSN